MTPREVLLDAGGQAYYEWATCNDDDESRWADESASGEQARRFARARAAVFLGAFLLHPDELLALLGLEQVPATSTLDAMGLWRVVRPVRGASDE